MYNGHKSLKYLTSVYSTLINLDQSKILRQKIDVNVNYKQNALLLQLYPISDSNAMKLYKILDWINKNS